MDVRDRDVSIQGAIVMDQEHRERRAPVEANRAWDEWQATLDRIRNSGGVTPERLAPYLQAPEENLRSWALKALADLEDPEVGRYLVASLADPSARVRIDALEALARRGLSQVAGRVAAMLRFERDALVRVFAAEALGELGATTKEVIDALLAAMRSDRKPLVRAYAAESLGRLGAVETVSLLRDHLRHERNARVRASLLESLSRLGDTHALPSLLRMLGRLKNWGVRTAVLNLLQGLETPQNIAPIEAAVAEIIRREPSAAQEQQEWFQGLVRRLGLELSQDRGSGEPESSVRGEQFQNSGWTRPSGSHRVDELDGFEGIASDREI